MKKLLLPLFLFCFISSAFAEVVTIKLLGINDYHGQIGAGATSKGRPVGGASVYAAYLREAQKGFEKNTIITFMGDMVGAAMPSSGLLDHQPTILFFNTLANQSCSFSAKFASTCNMVATLGNHEFDRGQRAMLELFQGTHLPPKNNWINLPKYPGAIFPVISANIVDEKTGKTLLPPYVIKNVRGIPIGFIGIILKNAETTMLPENAKGIKFLDEAETINRYAAEINKQNVKNIVVIMHEGGDSLSYEGNTRDNVIVNGAIKEIVSKLDDSIGVVMTGHTHRFLNAYLNNKNGKAVLVTQADSYSAAFADVTLHIDRDSQQLVDKFARIVYAYGDQYPGTTPDPTAAEIVKLAEDNVAPIVNEKVGDLTNDLSRFGNEAGESALGNLIADAFKESLHTDIAFTNSSSIRTNMHAGVVTWGDIYAIQPFENIIVKMTLNGRDILDLLEQQWQEDRKSILQVAGLHYTYHDNQSAGFHIIHAEINGEPLVLTKAYTVAVNTYLAYGGSGFSVFKRGTITERGNTDMSIVAEHIRHLPQPFTSKIEGRIKITT